MDALTAAADSRPEPLLPRLRQDLQLLPGPAAAGGTPTWIVYDPVRNSYFRIDWLAGEVLSRWHLGRASVVAATVSGETTLKVPAADVEAISRFLRLNELVEVVDPDGLSWLSHRAQTRRQGVLHRIIHGYLFFRIPLLRPDRFLAASVPWVAPLFSGVWRWTVIVMGLIGLLMASRQWDAFVGGLAEMASLEGAAGLALTVAVIKVLHEFGHAYAARRYGCPVPTMGIAFLVMWPVLFTDTTHAYRLVSRRQRLEVAGAGIMVELFIAALATFAWALLPPGGLRDAAQNAAVISLAGTLAVNLNPFMRFDGYYLLADALGMPNLQDRAFALAKWRLREFLFGLGVAMPESLAGPRLRLLIVYAFATWIYRFFLFLGIALLVYHFAFKILGIFLMGVEIVYFIALPIWRELAVWWGMRQRVGFNRRIAGTAAGMLGLVVLLAVPFPWPVKAPAVLQPVESVALYAPMTARVEVIAASFGTAVTTGAPLWVLKQPDLDFEAERMAGRALALATLIDRQGALAEGIDRVAVLQEELRKIQAALTGLAAQKARLMLTAPVSGRLVDVDAFLAPGRWVRPRELLGRIVSSERQVTALVAADDLPRLAAEGSARFIAVDPGVPAVNLRLTNIAAASADTLDTPYFSAAHGGPVPIATGKGSGGKDKPTVSVYRAELRPADQTAASRLPSQTIVGEVVFDTPSSSLVLRGWRAAAAVLIRERGF